MLNRLLEKTHKTLTGYRGILSQSNLEDSNMGLNTYDLLVLSLYEKFIEQKLQLWFIKYI